MRWHKLGLLFAAAGQYEWMASHAANPVPEHLGGDRFRIYFGTRDRLQRSHIAWVDVEIGARPRVLDLASAPLLAPGPPGAFDDSGTSMGCLVQNGASRYLYYVGWNLGVTVPWRNSIGLAISAGVGEPFVRVSRAPIMDRSDADPFSLSYPWVLREAGLWKMWYGSNLSWGPKEADMKHVIKYARSSDGLHWDRDGVPALNLDGPDEYALARPCVRRAGDRYQMWFCHRGSAYRIGYAESPDGLHWERRDDLAGIDVSATGWDSDMLAYPAIFDHAGHTYLLYNGNGYGRAGFGLAVADSCSWRRFKLRVTAHPPRPQTETA